MYEVINMNSVKTIVMFEDYANRMADILKKMGFAADVNIINDDGKLTLVAHCEDNNTSNALMQIRESHHNLQPEIFIDKV